VSRYSTSNFGIPCKSIQKRFGLIRATEGSSQHLGTVRNWRRFWMARRREPEPIRLEIRNDRLSVKLMLAKLVIQMCIDMFTFHHIHKCQYRNLSAAGAVMEPSRHRIDPRPQSVGCVLRESQMASHYVVHPMLNKKASQQGLSLGSACAQRFLVTTSRLLEMYRFKLFRRLFPRNPFARTLSISQRSSGRSLIASRTSAKALAQHS
jgi:hypothetical protein